MFENYYNNFIKNENKLYYKYEPSYGIGWILVNLLITKLN